MRAISYQLLAVSRPPKQTVKPPAYIGYIAAAPREKLARLGGAGTGQGASLGVRE
jgi:hypothetical protein